ncbi:MAG: sigma 54-interacting transcriptional regulator [Candidatus Eisenbacteria bacterium]|uniref:Sigma 54-interacting transcriptional regulator n=1 Tax=Eiseniibacteriota bacterium TaxID=2212470 RepID=A0A948W7A5_UNCEI|nr:sigma 54-interacting transcriptional regulator [Candidatus Eisenbacteria bacterium]MBU1949128.1 sigma 54-interacting transcriptional regulator [Candidatus Eisenbacteria bacterium]MBU2692394.1 sigma 54-interacting transcriptional regulator [Candidatus Eisenbacteria bacterium]
MRRTLLTFTGFHDPFTKGLLGDEEQPGPILSLVSARAFDRVILFETPHTIANSATTKSAIEQRNPEIQTEIRTTHLDDPTDYIAILDTLRSHFHEISRENAGDAYFIAVASGTPQMHASWILLAASGEIPAEVLNVRPPRFVTDDRPLVEPVNLYAAAAPLLFRTAGPIKDDTCLSPARPADSKAPSPNQAIEDPSAVLRHMGFVGDHPSMHRAIDIASGLAPSEAPILILGETGTGKELFARFIHRLSGRVKDRFVPLNCGAIPKELVESILFGHVKGAFTGAVRDQIGKFDQADGGTLFLDEIAELPSSAQAKLLRVLQDGVVEPVGAMKSHCVNVRVIAATHRNLGKAIHEHNFRDDLYYRIAVGVINLTPLRERSTDIPKIALTILDEINKTLRRPRRFSLGALQRFQNHTWPGNVRDLRNTIERSVRLAPHEMLEADDLLILDPSVKKDPFSALPEPGPDFSLEEFLSQTRKHLILRALEIAGRNQSQAARLLDLTPQAVHKFLKDNPS